MKTQEAIEFWGSRERLAQAAGVDRSAISHWGPFVPELRQYQLHYLSKGALKVDPRTFDRAS